MSMVDPDTKKIPLFHKFKVGFGVIVKYIFYVIYFDNELYEKFLKEKIDKY